MAQEQIQIANKRNYSTWILVKIIKRLEDKKLEIMEIRKNVLSGKINETEIKKWLDEFKWTMFELKTELWNLQKHINQSKDSTK